LSWQQARAGVQVKLLSEDSELYVFAESHDRIAKERSMRKRQLKWLWARLKQLQEMQLSREELLMRLGAARSRAPSGWRLVKVEVAADAPRFTYSLDRAKLRKARLRAQADQSMGWNATTASIREFGLGSAAHHCNRIDTPPPEPDHASGTHHPSQPIRCFRHARDRSRVEADFPLARPTSPAAPPGQQRLAPLRSA
jgi:hypothetical protein